MGTLTLEYKFNIGDKVVVSKSHTLFASSDPMGDPGYDINGQKGIVERIDLSHHICFDDKTEKQVTRTDIRYSVNFSGVNFSGNGFPILEDSLSRY